VANENATMGMICHFPLATSEKRSSTANVGCHSNNDCGGVIILGNTSNMSSIESWRQESHSCHLGAIKLGHFSDNS